MEQRNPDKPPVYSLLSVAMAMAVFYIVCVLFDAKGLHGWASKLEVSERSKRLQAWTAAHWQRMAGLGLEEPKHTIESAWLDLQEAHPLLYPKKFEAMMADRNRRKSGKRPEERILTQDAPQDDGNGGPRVLIVGDSIMVTVGPVLKKDIDARLAGRAVVKARVSTGLARPDVFDWRRELRDTLRSRRYDYVVMMLGTNDSQDFLEDGRILTYGTPDWVAAYNRRIATMMETSCRGARKAYWLGLPPMQSDAFNRKITRINSWAKRQAKRHSCVDYVALDRVIGDEKGAFASYLRVDDALEKIRMVDGIHITARGGMLISRMLLDFLSRDRADTAVAH